MIVQAGQYYLDQVIEEAPGVSEFTGEEYEIFALAGYIRMLKDEKRFHGQDAIFNGISWDSIIGSTEGRIYKISLQIVDQNKQYVRGVFRQTLNYMVKDMGKYTEHPFFSKRYYWDALEGNIIYEQLAQYDNYCINIFITSSSIKDGVANYFENSQ